MKRISLWGKQTKQKRANRKHIRLRKEENTKKNISDTVAIFLAAANYLHNSPYPLPPIEQHYLSIKPTLGLRFFINTESVY